MFMAGTGFGGRGCSQGTGSGSAGCNPRKFSEKIALHTQRQAEDTAAFQEVMMDITSTKLQAQRARQTRNLAPYYGGSLPNVNQIVRATCDTQGQLSYNPEHTCAGRHHLMSDQSHRERRLSPPGRPNRRHTDSGPYHSVLQSPPPGSYWRRNWPNSCPTDKGQEVRLPATALNRTNSDSALHTTVRNTHIGDQMSSAGGALTPRNRRSVFPYPVPLIEENMAEEGKPLKNDCKKMSEVPSGSAKACSQHAMSTPSQQGGSLLPLPSSLNLSGSLPDLSSLHLPSPQPTGLEVDPLGQASSLGSSNSSDHLSRGLTHPGLKTDDAYHLPGLSPMPVSLSNPLLQSSLSSPNIQTSLSSNSLPSSLSSASLRLSLSNSSLKSSLSNQSLLSSLSSSSLSNQSLQSAASHCSYSSGIGGSRSCSSSSLSGCSRASNQSLPPAAASRKRNQLSPLILPSGGDSRWHHPKQFSPTVSPTLSSITQGVLLNTNQMSRDSRPPAYPYNQPQHAGPPLSQQPLQHFPYASTEGQLHHQLPEPPVHSGNLPPSHPAPLPSQRQPQQALQHQQPYQPALYPKRQQLPQCQPHAQPSSQPQSHLLKHLQAPSPPPPQLQPYHSHDQAASGPNPHPHPHPHPPPGQQHHHQQQPYHCEPSQPLHHVGPPPPQQPYHPQAFTQQQQQQQQHHHSQWPPAHHLQPDHYSPHMHHHQQQQQQHQHQHPHQHHPPWPSPRPASMPGPSQGPNPWQKESALHGALSSVDALPAQEALRVATPMRVQGHRRSKSQLQEGLSGSGLSGGTQKMAQSLPTGISSQSGSCLDSGIGLNESYMGLQLTPSQTKALSQQLGQLCKESGPSVASDPEIQSGAIEKEAPSSYQNLDPSQDPKQCAGISHNLSDSMLTDAASWLDQEIAGFPAHMLELDEEALELSILRDEAFTSEPAVEGTFYNPAN